MDERISRLETQFSELAARFSALEQRLNSLEAGRISAGAATAKVLSQGTAPSALPPLTEGQDFTGTLALTGRLFIVLGGAYLLRALTDTSIFSAAAGISLGLGYALCWVFASGHASARNRSLSGAFHGIAGSLVAFPLVWEAVTRFRIISAPLDTAIIAMLTAVFLFVACRYRFQFLAWLTTVGAVATTLALLPTAKSLIPGTIFLIVLGVVTLWLGYELEWRGLRWLVACAADFAVFSVTMAALASRPRETPSAALLVQLLMLGLYLAVIAVRTVVRARNVIPFEVFQVIVSFLLGFVGAVYTTRITGIGSNVLGITALILGGSCYAVAFAFMDRQAGRARNFYFYTSLALLFTMTGTKLLLSGTSLSVAWVFLAVVMTWLGWGHARFALTLHATICIIAASVSSNMLFFAGAAFVGAAQALTPVTLAHSLVIAGAAACIFWPLPARSDAGPALIRAQRIGATLILISGIGAVVIWALGSVWAILPNGNMDAGILATVRTMVLAAAALILAWMGRRNQFQEWGWLLYPVLAITALKMLFEDFQLSRPSTLFLALAAYGCVLILSPRLRRKPGTADSV